MAFKGSTEKADRTFRFGAFELSESEGELRKNGVPIKLQEQPFRVLLELVANAGKVVSREDLQQKLWPADTFVDFDVGLNTAIRKLRQALNDDVDHPHYIETLARRGYRFVAQVAVTAPEQAKAEPSAMVSPVTDGIAAAEPAAYKPSAWRSSLRLWQLAATGVALLALGIGIAWLMRPAPQRVLKEQRITANPADTPVTGAVISPDGKYVAYSDQTGVYIRHIDSGETRPLTLPKRFDGIPTSWFPDSMHLLLANHDGPQHTAKIWKASILGGNPQMLLEDAEQAVVSPDGSRIAFFRGNVDTRELWLADADGQNPHRLVEHEPEHSGKTTDSWSASWSPDGRRIAYIHRESVATDPTGDKFSVYTQKADGSDVRLILQDDRLDYGTAGNGNSQPSPLVWAPNGRLYFALRSRAQVGTPDHDVWSIAVDRDTGRPLERPRELLRGLGWIGGLSASQIGRRLLFWRSDITGQVFVSEFNGSTRMMGPPRRLTLDQSVGTIPVDWTADSKAVVLLSVRNGKPGLYKQRVDETTPELLFSFRKASGTFPRLSGDGSEILYGETDSPNDPNAPVSLMAVPISGGTPRVILSEPGVNDAQCAKPPSQVCVLIQSLMGTSFYYLLDLNNGKGRLLAKLPRFANYGLSPDGSTLALMDLDDARTVRFVSIDSGSVKVVPVKDWPVRKDAGGDWSADSKVLLTASVNTEDVPVVVSVDIEGNVKVLLQGDRNIPFNWIIPSPDGKYGALAVTTGESNVWMVENY